MGITIGPVDWWLDTPDTLNALIASCPEGTVLPDKSVIICKAGGVAWIVAPACTQVSSTWNGTTDTLVGDKCCVCDWSSLCSALVSAGFNPSDWFVPSCAQLQNPGYVCRTKWDVYNPNLCGYWTSTEYDSTCGFCLNCCGSSSSVTTKSSTVSVRAFRCVTY
jgi:hypothetical protein